MSSKELTIVSASLALAISLFSGQSTLAESWKEYVQNQFDASNANYIGNLLGPSEQQILANFDDERQKVDNLIGGGIASGTITPERGTQFRDELGQIAALQNQYITGGPISFSDAQGLLLKLNTLKANVQAALKGAQAPERSDYFDAKDPIQFRDHLLRKLYYYRTNGKLTESEYDEYRSHVDHVGQGLARGVNKNKVLARMKQLDDEITKLVKI